MDGSSYIFKPIGPSLSLCVLTEKTRASISMGKKPVMDQLAYGPQELYDKDNRRYWHKTKDEHSYFRSYPTETEAKAYLKFLTYKYPAFKPALSYEAFVPSSSSSSSASSSTHHPKVVVNIPKWQEIQQEELHQSRLSGPRSHDITRMSIGPLEIESDLKAYGWYRMILPETKDYSKTTFWNTRPLSEKEAETYAHTLKKKYPIYAKTISAVRLDATHHYIVVVNGSEWNDLWRESYHPDTPRPSRQLMTEIDWKWREAIRAIRDREEQKEELEEIKQEVKLRKALHDVGFENMRPKYQLRSHSTSKNRSTRNQYEDKQVTNAKKKKTVKRASNKKSTPSLSTRAERAANRNKTR